MKIVFYKDIYECPMYNFIEAYFDKRYLLVLKDYKNLPKVNKKQAKKLQNLFDEFSFDGFSNNNNVDKIIKYNLLRNRVRYMNLLVYHYNNLSSYSYQNKTILKLMKENRLKGNLKIDVKYIKKIDRKVKVQAQELNIKTESAENIDFDFKKMIYGELSAMSKYLKYRINPKEFTVNDYRVTFDMINKDEKNRADNR